MIPNILWNEFDSLYKLILSLSHKKMLLYLRSAILIYEVSEKDDGLDCVVSDVGEHSRGKAYSEQSVDFSRDLQLLRLRS